MASLPSQSSSRCTGSHVIKRALGARVSQLRADVVETYCGKPTGWKRVCVALFEVSRRPLRGKPFLPDSR